MRHDIDPKETAEWREALYAVLMNDGTERAQFLIQQLIQSAKESGCKVDSSLNTPYKNTIEIQNEIQPLGNLAVEARLEAWVRWNAAAMVVRAAQLGTDLGGHIGTFASAATLYEVGFNHFWRAPNVSHGGDLLYIQGHAAPGIYARSYLEGILSETHLEHFRQETKGSGLSSYPHPWLMPNYWQFPTVSMGLGPLQAVHQARLMKYLEARGLIKAEDRKVWCFCGDGEMDEPESVAALRLAAREQLDNLIFVINCNLQRLDGPVRGNSSIIQELESLFHGSGWNVIKVIWGGLWDALFAKDKQGILLKRIEEMVDGDYQNYAAKGGAYLRKHFFGKYPELQTLVAHLSDEELGQLNRGGHDVGKIYNAYQKAVDHKTQPTVILAKTVKGYGLGSAGEALNTAHNVKKMDFEHLKQFRDRFKLPLSDEQVEAVIFYRPEKNSPEMRYLTEKRQALGGSLPSRRLEAEERLVIPSLATFATQLQGSGREISTTMAFVRLLTTLCKDKNVGSRIVPIVPDEARTFGMEGLFRQLGIYSHCGQLYVPVDSEQVMFYKETTNGQILEEGINEAGAFASWIAAATSYSTHNVTLIPFYIFYSMFGFQRIADLAWAAGDSRARGFLLGATAGRTTLNGEGLQHEDGHSHILANTIPNCISYDPTFSYELAVIIQEGLVRMYQNNESIFYYITLMNENYIHPAIVSEEIRDGILKGIYRFQKSDKKSKLYVQLLGCGTILQEVIAASELLAKDFEVSADVWSVTSFNELGRDGLECHRWNRMHPLETQKIPYITECLQDTKGPVIAATDYMKSFSDQVRAFIPRRFEVLGTDGFGRSDSRENLRTFFEVNRYYIAVAALKALADEGEIPKQIVVQAIEKYQLDPNKKNPLHL